ncbi:MAG: aminotransferase class I/II-fold pyridoxal phosphate-dependent enzyme [Lawsonibacter sp.]|jgi:arginine/lysine/ornithine decarboxylase
MTPLYDAIRAFSAQDPIRLHIPGHKGKPLPIPELTGVAALDFTELGPTGDLFHGGEPFDSAQRLWAEDFSMECCQFLTGGSTLGLHTALALCCRPGDRVLIDRGCHRAVYNALALLDLDPVYLPRPWWEEERLTSTISPEAVEKALTEHPEIKTICITSPSYSGLLCNIQRISHIVHRNGGRLIVDGAHGAHLPFLGVDAFSGADLVVCSAHKTLPALGQSSLLFANGFEPEQMRRMTSVYGSSSPSYPMMISMDGARDWMEGEGKLLYRRTAERTAALRERFPSLQEGALDPTRLTLNAVDGPALARALEARGLWPEMEDGGHVVLILTGMDSGEDLDRLERGLEEVPELLGRCPPIPAPPMPERVLSPREALFARTERLPLEGCAGRVSAVQLAPYPPGVPVVAPGERITEKELAYLREIGYNNHEVSVIL